MQCLVLYIHILNTFDSQTLLETKVLVKFFFHLVFGYLVFIPLPQVTEQPDHEVKPVQNPLMLSSRIGFCTGGTL